MQSVRIILLLCFPDELILSPRNAVAWSINRKWILQDTDDFKQLNYRNIKKDIHTNKKGWKEIFRNT